MAITTAPIKLYIVFFLSVWRTPNVAKNRITFITVLPILANRVRNNITANIPIEIIKDKIPFPFPYQQIYASIGVNKVIIYQIII